MFEFLKRFKKTKNRETSFLRVDFVKSFPHIFWISRWGREREHPSGTRHKIMTVRNEPNGDFELVISQELADGTRTKLSHLSVPADKFEAVEQVVRDFETCESQTQAD